MKGMLHIRQQSGDVKRYERVKMLASLATLVVYIAIPAFFLVTEASAGLSDIIWEQTDEIVFISEHTVGMAVLGAIIYAVVASVAIELLTLPISYYSGHALEKRYGLSKQNFFGWVIDWLKSLGLQTVMLGIFIGCVYALLATDPDLWWLWASILFSVIAIFMAAIAPIVLMPIFFKFEPLPDGELKSRLVRLSDNLGTYVQGAYIWRMGERTVKANAALAGWGKTRRIIISDTLINSHDADEIEVIIAHELGHHVNGDIWRGIIVQVVIIFISMWFIDQALIAWSDMFGINGTLYDYANLPLLALVTTFVGIIALPLVNTYSRRRETAADDFAIATTGMRAEFISAMRKLGDMNMSNTEPHPLVEFALHSHPSISRRIERAGG